MSDPVLRRAEPADAARLSLLGAATFLHSFAHDHPGDAMVAHVDSYHSKGWYQAMLADPACAAWLLETELKAPIGYAVLTPPDLDCPTDPGDLELKRIYVLGPWQSGGWGVKLVDALESEARARGAKRLYLCVYKVNVAAQRFYARHGFVDTGHIQDFRVGDVSYQDLIFVKPLA
jgi:ribosomal protein S18 acetylase RimI-like enzyme